MITAEYLSGLDTFSDRHAQVQKQLSAIELNGMVFRSIDRYRELLEELIQIGMERGRYCAQWRDEELIR